jgi:hypothetical protein
MIEYDMRLENNIDWNQARKNFQRFLRRHLNIDESSVDIEGITWDANSCWYIMNATPALIQALINSNSNYWKAGVGIAALSVAVIGIYVLKR